MDKCNFGCSLVCSQNIFFSQNDFCPPLLWSFKYEMLFFSANTQGKLVLKVCFFFFLKQILAFEVPPKCDARQVHKSVVDIFCIFRNRNLPSAHEYLTGEFELHKRVSLKVDIHECFFQCWMRAGNLSRGLSLSLFFSNLTLWKGKTKLVRVGNMDGLLVFYFISKCLTCHMR